MKIVDEGSKVGKEMPRLDDFLVGLGKFISLNVKSKDCRMVMMDRICGEGICGRMLGGCISIALRNIWRVIIDSIRLRSVGAKVPIRFILERPLKSSFRILVSRSKLLKYFIPEVTAEINVSNRLVYLFIEFDK